jgi:hypothetical protein
MPVIDSPSGPPGRADTMDFSKLIPKRWLSLSLGFNRLRRGRWLLNFHARPACCLSWSYLQMHKTRNMQSDDDIKTI